MNACSGFWNRNKKAVMKTKIIYLSQTFIVSFLLIFLSVSCKKEEQKIIKEKLTGKIQKGPYVNGTTISMSELSSSLTQTGKVFTTQITNNIGSFEIDNIDLSSEYVEFSANGYYYDEIKGDISLGSLSLYAVSDIKDLSSVNVNILTHLEKQRVSYLIKNNKSFSEAKKTAQKEILSIFGFLPDGVVNSETLDISCNSESNAILLAISIILQGNRTVGSLTELLANISNDLKEDGNLNNVTILNDLRNSTKGLILSSIRTNLEERYKNLGVDAAIPDFEKYTRQFLAFTGKKPTAAIEAATNIATTTATFNGSVNPDYINTNVSFEWGETTAYGNTISVNQNPVTGGSSVKISASVTGLLPGKTYHLRVKAENTAGIGYSDDITFTTAGKTPEAVAMSATDIFFRSAMLNGTVNANLLSTTTQFEWGTTTNYGNTTIAAQSPVTGNSPVNVNAGLSDLNEETTYHFRIRAENSLGVTYSNDRIFTTTGKSPIPITKAAANIQMDCATLKGTVNANSFSTTVIFEWGTTDSYGNTATVIQSPLTANTYQDVSADLTGLNNGTTYHYRIKAANEYGTRTSEDMVFTTLAPVTDYEGNRYNVRTFGTQIWMIENLKSTKYSDGTPISFGLYFPGNNITNVAKFGYLYDWAAAIKQPAKYDTIMLNVEGLRVQGACPTSWHLPSENEWLQLINLYGGKEVAGLKLKIANPGYWLEPVKIEAPLSGFNAIPAGRRFDDGTYNSVGNNAAYWTTSQWLMGGAIMGRNVEMIFLLPNVTIYHTNGNNAPGSVGLSIRCIKD